MPKRVSRFPRSAACVRRDPRAPQRSGFGLVELLVALTILGAGILAVAGTALVAAHRLRSAELQQEAVLVAAGILDSLVFAGPPVTPAARQVGRLGVSWDAAGAGIGVERVTVYVRDGTTLLLHLAAIVAAPPVDPEI